MYMYVQIYACILLFIFKYIITGSAHCTLAPYYFNHSAIKSPIKSSSNNDSSNGSAAKMLTTLTGYQASKRGGIVNVTLKDDRVLLSGPCTTTIKSKILF